MPLHRNEAERLIDACRKQLTIIDVNIQPTGLDDYQEARGACAQLDTLVSNLHDELKSMDKARAG